MTRVTTSKDCGNSPKNKFAEEIAVAIEKNDKKAMVEMLTDDVIWQLDSGVIRGKEDFLGRISAKKKKPAKIVIEHVVTHGKADAVNGISSYGKDTEERFCHVLEFANTKCKTLSRVFSYRSSASSCSY